MLKIKERRSVHVSIDLIRQYSDLSQQIKEPQNGIYCLNFFKNDHILKRRHGNKKHVYILYKTRRQIFI